MDDGHPIDVVVVNDYQIIVEGLASMLKPFSDRLRVRQRMLIGDDVDGAPVHLALFDTYGRAGVAEPALRTLLDDDDIQHIAVFSLEFAPPLLAAARSLGVRSFISKALSAEEIAEAAVRAARGEAVVELPADGAAVDGGDAERRWPGRGDGLTERESQALVLLAEGLTNAEIGEALFVNVETVRSRLKQAYRKLGLRNRSQATAYVVASGAFRRFQPAETALAKDPGETIDESPEQGQPNR